MAKKVNKNNDFTEEESKKLKEILSQSAWSVKGFPKGAFAEDTETPIMAFDGEHQLKLKKIREYADMQADLEIAMRQKAIRVILGDNDNKLLEQMNDIKNDIVKLEEEKKKMKKERAELNKQIQALNSEREDLEEEKKSLIKKVEKRKKEIIHLKDTTISNGTIRDLEI